MNNNAFGDVLTVVRRRSERVVSTVGLIFVGFIGLLAIVMTPVEKTEPVGNVVGIAFFVPVILWFVGGIRAAKTVVYEHVLLVQNWFTQYCIPWSAVADVESAPGVTVKLTDGRLLGIAVGAVRC